MNEKYEMLQRYAHNASAISSVVAQAAMRLALAYLLYQAGSMLHKANNLYNALVHTDAVTTQELKGE